MKNNSKLAYSILIGILLASAFFAAGGCTSAEDGFRTFTLNKDFAHFTFEYPSKYRITRTDITNESNNRSSEVWLDWNFSPNPAGSVIILVTVDESNQYFPNADALYQSELSQATKTWNDSNFNLVENSSLMVTGVQSPYVAYTFDAPPPDNLRLSFQPTPCLSQMVYFDHGNLIGGIYIQGAQSQQDEFKAEFTHIVETFKFLN